MVDSIQKEVRQKRRRHAGNGAAREAERHSTAGKFDSTPALDDAVSHWSTRQCMQQRELRDASRQ
jgi:hypothetical protein